jgi:hypothetical protein
VVAVVVVVSAADTLLSPRGQIALTKAVVSTTVIAVAR